MDDKSRLMLDVTGKISSGHELMKNLSNHKNIRSMGKLIRKINQEIRFLEKVYYFITVILYRPVTSGSVSYFISRPVKVKFPHTNSIGTDGNNIH